MSILAMVKGKKATFTRFQCVGETQEKKQLWYRLDDGFEFPIPVEDTGTAAFEAQHDAINLMRWIRLHLEFISQSKETEGLA